MGEHQGADGPAAAPEPGVGRVSQEPARGAEPADPWARLRAATPARVGLGRSGDSLPVRANLAFDLDHARARDAVRATLDVAALADALRAGGHESVVAHSAVGDRATYLRRPDLGRRLVDDSREAVAALRGSGPPPDAVFVVADGLSADAVLEHAPAVLSRSAARLGAAGWHLAPTVIVTGGRVAIGDDIGGLLGAAQVVVLLGERPGLSVPRSLGAYLTAAPRPGRSDAERNCISNIHARGLSADEAAELLVHLMLEARRVGGTGVMLKDERASRARLTFTG